MNKTVKKRSIRTQMSRTVTIVSLLSILILGITCMSGLWRMRAQTQNVTASMGEQAASDSREILETEALEQLADIASATARTVDANIQSITSQVDILAASAQALYAAPDRFGRVEVLPPDAANQGTYVAQVVYAQRTPPETVADELGLIGNLTIQMNGTSEFLSGAGTTQIGTESGFIVMCDENSSLKTSMGYLDPVERSWYRMAADGGKLVWSDVFEDSYGRGLAVTCGKPVYGPDGQLQAVISIGSTLDDVGTAVTELTIGESGYAFVVNRSGEVIMSRDLTVDSTGHVIGTSNLWESDAQAVRDAMTQISQGKSGVTQARFNGTPVYMAYESMEHMPWTVVTVMSVDEVLSPAVEGEARISALADDASAQIGSIMTFTAILFIVAVVAAVAISIALSGAMAMRITRPLSDLTQQVETIGEGNLDAHIDIQTGDEIQTLADTFNTMTASLRQYIRDLTSVTAEKERIGAELNVATQIQKDMLPNIFPAFPERPEFDIYATMDPAKEVGGDFYDFFMVDEHHLAVVMADVSGKGVPAALFMVIAKTIIKNQALAGDAVEQVFMHANDQLCENNGEGLFVTAFMGILDLRDGTFVYANAGHNPPLLRRKGGTYEYLKMDAGFVLAGLDGIPYESSTMTLFPGDTLYLYTDGVTEAMNEQFELYGEQRLWDALNSEAGQKMSVHELLPFIRTSLSEYAGNAEQADDITMLGLTFLSNSQSEKDSSPKDDTFRETTLTLPAQRERLEQVQNFVDAALADLPCDPAKVLQLQIAVEEIYVNIASYAYAPNTGDATVICRTWQDPPRIQVQFRDQGIPFDPLAKEDADITLSAEERDIGGLGIYMLKDYMDAESYVYEDGQNILTFEKYL